jgi:hypothetical protein
VGKGRPKSINCPRGHLMEETRKFHPNGDSYCSACKVIRYNTFRKENPTKVAKYSQTSRRRNTYGISPDQYKDLWESQIGLCGICFSILKEDRTTHIDHDHSTGIIRGLLCHNCNTALGLLKEDTETMKSMITYLSKAGKSNKGKTPKGY